MVLDAMRGDARTQAFIDRLLLGSQPVAVSAITVMELHEGVGRARVSEAEAARVQAALLGVVTYPFSHEVAERAGRLLARLGTRGRPVGVPDVMIGATALHHGEPVATRNRREFERIPGLEVLTP